MEIRIGLAHIISSYRCVSSCVDFNLLVVLLLPHFLTSECLRPLYLDFISGMI